MYLNTPVIFVKEVDFRRNAERLCSVGPASLRSSIDVGVDVRVVGEAAFVIHRPTNLK